MQAGLEEEKEPYRRLPQELFGGLIDDTPR